MGQRKASRIWLSLGLSGGVSLQRSTQGKACQQALLVSQRHSLLPLCYPSIQQSHQAKSKNYRELKQHHIGCATLKGLFCT